MGTHGEYPTTVALLIEFRDGHGSRDGDLTESQSLPSRPKGAAAIGGAAPVPESGPLGGVHQSPELRAPVRDAADGVVSAELPFLAELCSAPMAGAIQLVQGVKPCGKQGVALLKRSRRRWFGIVRPDPHGGQNSQLWLINSCERAPRGRDAVTSHLVRMDLRKRGPVKGSGRRSKLRHGLRHSTRRGEP